MILLALTCALFAFLVGGIPFGYLTGRLVLHDDIRNHGSGNIGATNVGRVLGWKWGAIVLILDALKGMLPTMLTAAAVTGRFPAVTSIFCRVTDFPHAARHITIAAGVCAIIGHMYPIYLRLRGGKGVATALGVIAVIAPVPTLVSLGSFLLTIAISRIVAVASIVASLTFAVVQLSLLGRSAWTLSHCSLTAFSIVIPLLITWRHRSNILKLLQPKP